MATSTPPGTGLIGLQSRAKRPVTVLAGPYGHPVHPILVTVPIGAWVTSFVFDIASSWAGEPEVLVKASFWMIGIGIIGAIAAAVFGLLDLIAIPRGTRAFRTALIHMVLNLTVVVLFAVHPQVGLVGVHGEAVAARSAEQRGGLAYAVAQVAAGGQGGQPRQEHLCETGDRRARVLD